MATYREALVGLALVLALGLGSTAQAEPAGHITGVGGVFVKSKDPRALARWYRDVLGVPVASWGGATFETDAPGHPPVVVWNAVRDTSDYMAPSTREFMVNSPSMIWTRSSHA